MSYLALRFLLAIVFLCSLARGSNDTISSNATITYTGWHNSPAERGTMTILWSCLTAIFACAWTILHLNVPNPGDTIWRKFWRKTKWMAVTVVFPELIFAKAVCELQMAVEDLRELKLMQDETCWDVQYGWGCQLLYFLLHPHSFSWSELRTDSNLTRGAHSRGDIFGKRAETWTLTHCHFANMGGVIKPMQGRDIPIAAHALVHCCLQNGQSLDTFRLSREEILDKSKADLLLKIVAAIQMFWILVPVVTRKARNLPLSLLEVCTAAFAVLSIATYALNMGKPKDIDIPVKLNDASYRAHACRAGELSGSSFYGRIIESSITPERAVNFHRIPNDAIRQSSKEHGSRTFDFALALSTLVFGGIHCAA